MAFQLGEYEFSLKELSGAVGDFGTLLPLAIGFMVVNEMHPAHFMVVFGLTNVATGLIYKAPMPLQPMKAVAAVAISQQWTSSLLSATGLSMGIFWLLMGTSGGIQDIIRRTPESVIRGVQLSLGISLGFMGISMILEDIWWLGLATIALIWLLGRNNGRNPSALVIVVIGVIIAFVRGGIEPEFTELMFPAPAFPQLHLAWQGFLQAGIGQIPLTLTNAVIACTALLKEYFPDKDIPERRLMLNMGVMNVISSVMGGFPMCHGAGGLASQYYFGARTGGANVMEGTLEALIGILFGSTLLHIFRYFPMALVGGMLVIVGIELGKFSRGLQKRDIPAAAATVLFGTVFNLGAGFAAGLLAEVAYSALRDGDEEDGENG